MSTPDLGHLATLGNGAWYRSLPAPLQDWLCRHGRLLPLAAGQQLFARDGGADGLYAVLDGAVRIGAVSAAGEEAILAILGPAQWIGEIALFDGLARTHDARAERDSLLLHVPLRALQELLAAQPAYWQDFGRLMAQKLRQLFAVVEVVALLPAPARVARVLMAIAEGYGERRACAGQRVRLSQEQLARMVSLARQSVNQIMGQFEVDGAIRRVRGGFEVCDVQRLRRLAM